MNIAEREIKDVVVFAVEGRVDTQGAVDLDLALQTAVEAGKTKMVLELAELRYISSAGLRTLADVLTKNKAAGGDLKLAAVNRKIMRVLQIVGFDKFFASYDSVDEAVSAF